MAEVSVYFYWEPNQELKKFLNYHLKKYCANLYFKNDLSEKEFKAIIPKVQVIVGWRPTKELLTQAKKLKLLINPGAGVQHLKEFLPTLKSRKITLVNGHGNAYFTAQHAVAMLMAVTNQIIFHHNMMLEGKWRLGDKEAASIPLQNKTVGLLGYGHVNQTVHKLLSGFDLNFSILKRTWKKTINTPTPYKKYKTVELQAFLKNCDIVIIALPLTEATKSIIGEEEFENIGKEGLLVNVGRGEIINEQSLYKALKQKTIKAAAIDVWYNYQPEEMEGKKRPYNYPFYKLDNLLLSPHRAASPFSDLNRWNEVVYNITEFINGNYNFINIVNLDEGY